MNKIIERAFQIPGLYAEMDAELLVRLASRGGELVEIGCYKGRTTALIMQACEPHGGKLTSIDPFIEPGASYDPASPEMWRANLESIGIEPPALLHMKSDDAIAQFEGKRLSFVFIDGCHCYDCVISDLRNWTPLIEVGGVVVLHDMYFPGIAGVCKAVADWFTEEPREHFRFVDHVQYTIAFERKRE